MFIKCESVCVGACMHVCVCARKQNQYLNVTYKIILPILL